MTIEAAPSDAPFALVSGCIHTKVDARVYRLTAVQKAAYRLAARCTVVIGAACEHLLPITLTFASTVTENEARQLAQLFFRELLDQELREKIGEETAALRALILAHAFSKTDLVNRQ
jgi:His-Xaa-Ser system protein HxsD